MKQKLAGQPGVTLVTVWQTVSLATLELISKSWEPSPGGMEAPAGQSSMLAAVPLLQLPLYPFQPGTAPFVKKEKEPVTRGASNPPLTTIEEFWAGRRRDVLLRSAYWVIVRRWQPSQPSWGNRAAAEVEQP